MYKFIIDTDQYSGNFEREMCAYLTGRIGECGVGKDFVEIFQQEVGSKISFDNVSLESDDDHHDCFRPCEIEINPNWFNTGMGNCYRKSDTDDIKILKEYADAIFKYEISRIDQAKAIKERLLKGETYSNWTIHACDKDISIRENAILESKNAKTYNKYSAYLSVAIFFEDRPTIEQISLMKERVYNFDKAYRLLQGKWKKDFTLTIEGFRLVEILQKETEEVI